VFKRKHKNRKNYTFYYNETKLTFGSAGALLLNPCHLTAKRLFRLKLFFKRASRKADYTKRFVWLHAFPHLPLTKKPTGTRMGKGKGKLECWYTSIPGGVVLVEFRNLRLGRARYFFKQLTHKLGINTKFIFFKNAMTPFPLFKKKNFFLNVRW
jgi:ribosomal protein L16